MDFYFQQKSYTFQHICEGCQHSKLCYGLQWEGHFIHTSESTNNATQMVETQKPEWDLML